MKKTLISALTTALVVGAASTTFAAANPFEDVPADHWAYDAIAQLAADGVIEGYGDGTYRGDQEITRYEMAQMVARAMAKGGGDKALIDKLAAEFADELNNLGVRVAALEKKVDNVKWKGEIRYQFTRRIRENSNDDRTKDSFHKNGAQLRLKPSFDINKNWRGYAGLYYGKNSQELNNAKNIDNVEMRYAYAEGVYGNTVIDLGKTILFTNLDEGMIYDGRLTGGIVTFGKDLKFSLAGGRTKDFVEEWGVLADGTSSYWGAELIYNKDKLKAGIGYHHFGDEKNWTAAYGAKSADIGTIGLGYKFGKFRLFGAYAQNFKGENDVLEANGDLGRGDQRKSYTIQLEYGGAKLNKPGSFGLEAGYRHLGKYTTLAPTYDYTLENRKGWFVGGKVTLLPNFTLHLGYSNGKMISTEKKDQLFYSRFQFFF